MGKWPECHENCFEVRKRGVWIFAGFTQLCQFKKWSTGKTHLLILRECDAVVHWHDFNNCDNQTIYLNWAMASKTTSSDHAHSYKKVTNTQHKQLISKRATTLGKCTYNHSKAFLCFLSVSVILLIIFQVLVDLVKCNFSIYWGDFKKSESSLVHHGGGHAFSPLHKLCSQNINHISLTTTSGI